MERTCRHVFQNSPEKSFHVYADCSIAVKIFQLRSPSCKSVSLSISITICNIYIEINISFKRNDWLVYYCLGDKVWSLFGIYILKRSFVYFENVNVDESYALENVLNCAKGNGKSNVTFILIAFGTNLRFWCIGRTL